MLAYQSAQQRLSKPGSFVKTMLRKITFNCCPKSEDGERFIALGLKRSHLHTR